MMNKIIVLALAVFISACSGHGYDQGLTSKEIWAEIEANNYKAIDFAKISGQAWTRVCFIGPYNEDSEQILGFPWHVSEHTDALKSDSHNVIVFATESDVLEFVVHPRDYGDFWKLSGHCLNRESSKLTKDIESGDWLNYIRPEV
jgi:hypothetical protein